MKSITLQQVLSATVALASLAEWTYLGFATPAMKGMHKFFQADPREFDFPYPYVMSLHWAWCVPVGILVATGIIVKDRWFSRNVAGVINLAVFLAGMVLALLWLWGVVPHHMIQTTRPNKVTAVNAPIASWFQFGHPWRRVTEQRRSADWQI